MKMIILFASITIAGGLLFTNVYNSIVDAKSWGANIPESINTARQYYKYATPASFYRLFSPVNQVLALLVLIVFWKASPSAKLYAGIALVLYVAGDIFTFAYFYPRNAIMFTNPAADWNVIKKAWQEWSTMNWLRSAIIFAGLIFSFIALHKIYSAK